MSRVITPQMQAYMDQMMEASEEEFILWYRAGWYDVFNMPTSTRAEQDHRIDWDIHMKEVLKARLQRAYHAGLGL